MKDKFKTYDYAEDERSTVVCDCGVIHTFPMTDWNLMAETGKKVHVICAKCGANYAFWVDEDDRGVRRLRACENHSRSFGHKRDLQNADFAADITAQMNDACKVYYSYGYDIPLENNKIATAYKSEGFIKKFFYRDDDGTEKHDCQFIDRERILNEYPKKLYENVYRNLRYYFRARPSKKSKK